MKDEPRVIQADFATWRPVAGRKILQLILEVPIEQTKDVLDKLGVPTPGESRWVAVALLDLQAQAKPSGSPKPSGRKWEEMPYSAQAAIRCGEELFKRHLQEEWPKEWESYSGDVQMIVRKICGCKSSRAEFDIMDSMPRLGWRSLERQYQEWLTDQKYSEARR